MNKILVVDDDISINELIKINLEMAGYEVFSANDGVKGFALCKQELPDLVILDVMMPKINGYKICRLLKFDTKYKNIPIVMVTARGQAQDIAIGEETGADEYITKPFEFNELYEVIKKHLGE